MKRKEKQNAKIVESNRKQNTRSSHTASHESTGHISPLARTVATCHPQQQRGVTAVQRRARARAKELLLCGVFFCLRCDDRAAASATRVRCTMTCYCLSVQRSAGGGAMRVLSLREQDDSVVECMAIFKVSEFDALSGYGADIYWRDKSLNCAVTAIRWMTAVLRER